MCRLKGYYRLWRDQMWNSFVVGQSVQKKKKESVSIGENATVCIHRLFHQMYTKIQPIGRQPALTVSIAKNFTVFPYRFDDTKKGHILHRHCDPINHHFSFTFLYFYFSKTISNIFN